MRIFIHWRLQLMFSMSWAALIASIVAYDFIQRGWPVDTAVYTIAAFYFFGSFAGGYLAHLVASTFCDNKVATVRFSLFFVCLTVFTIGCTILMFVVQHRIYFSQWHSDVGTIKWFFQLVFTGLGSVVLFAVSGLRPLLPWGVLLLILASFCFSRGWLSRSH